ncbi:MAG: aspartate/glutamate racemase family protein, partial [Chlamydiia bacterium]|nr:aspartate/glutamate racemase family protein [Chlamydiia bacterium]
KQKMKNLPMYLTGAAKFFQSECQSYVMASNTAHMFHTEMNILARNKLTNLLDQAVITQFKPGDRVLVLGTKKAYDANLYPNALKRREITPVPVSEEDAGAIQRFIDATKEHRNPNPEDLKVFLEKYPHSHVLLGCTELPLALHGDLLLEETTTANTEALFAEFIAKKLQ